jgi:hypothetical protein
MKHLIDKALYITMARFKQVLMGYPGVSEVVQIDQTKIQGGIEFKFSLPICEEHLLIKVNLVENEDSLYTLNNPVIRVQLDRPLPVSSERGELLEDIFNISLN